MSYCWRWLYQTTNGFFSHLNKITSNGSAEIFGVILGVFFASGAVGYIFANIYYTTRERINFLRNDHRILLKKFIDEYGYQIKVTDTNGERGIIDANGIRDLSLREAWEIFNLIWYEVKPKSIELKEVEPQIDTLLNILHSLGSTLFGSSICLLIWFLLQSPWLLFHLFDIPIFEKNLLGPVIYNSGFVNYSNSYIFWLILILSLWAIFIISLFLSFTDVRNTIRRYYHSYLTDFVNDHWSVRDRTVRYIRDKRERQSLFMHIKNLAKTFFTIDFIG